MRPFTPEAAMDSKMSARDELREATRTEIENLRSALIAEGHAPDCPVIHNASVDCVPGGGCTARTTRATYPHLFPLNEGEREALADLRGHVGDFLAQIDWMPHTTEQEIAVATYTLDGFAVYLARALRPGGHDG
jgi:hypothetical protein